MKKFVIKDSKGKCYYVEAKDERDAAKKFRDSKMKDSYESDLKKINSLYDMVKDFERITNKYKDFQKLKEQTYIAREGSSRNRTPEQEKLIKQYYELEEKALKEQLPLVKKWNTILEELDRSNQTNQFSRYLSFSEKTVKTEEMIRDLKETIDKCKNSFLKKD